MRRRKNLIAEEERIKLERRTTNDSNEEKHSSTKNQTIARIHIEEVSEECAKEDEKERKEQLQHHRKNGAR